jgi:uncharacterized membrane-anchored protein YitT (DUF2179 family)
MPQKHRPQRIFTTWQKLSWDLILLTIGSILCAVSINSIVIPEKFATGGITGLALIIHTQLPWANTGWIYIAINIPLFLLAWMAVGRRFFFYSLVGTAIFTAALFYVQIPIEMEDKILSSLLAGIILGAGTGIGLKSSGSLGGMDLLSVMLLKRYSIGLGNTILISNAIVLLLVTFFYSLDAVLYTLIVLYVSSHITNLVITGLSQRKSVMIISPKWQEISEMILHKIHRGTTILQGEGGYTGTPERIIYTIVTLGEIAQLKARIRKIDPDAFVVVSSTIEVMNYRIGNQPHW